MAERLPSFQPILGNGSNTLSGPGVISIYRRCRKVFGGDLEVFRRFSSLTPLDRLNASPSLNLDAISAAR